MYYIISLRHTATKDKYLTLWRAENAGYCYSKEMAGVYPEYKKGYHDDCGNMPIKVEDAAKLMQVVDYEGQQKTMLPNTRTVLKALNLKRIKGELTQTA